MCVCVLRSSRQQDMLYYVVFVYFSLTHSPTNAINNCNLGALSASMAFLVHTFMNSRVVYGFSKRSIGRSRVRARESE